MSEWNHYTDTQQELQFSRVHPSPPPLAPSLTPQSTAAGGHKAVTALITKPHERYSQPKPSGWRRPGAQRHRERCAKERQRPGRGHRSPRRATAPGRALPHQPDEQLEGSRKDEVVAADGPAPAEEHEPRHFAGPTHRPLPSGLTARRGGHGLTAQ